MHEERSAPAPALKKIDLTIARLRLLLADVTAREAAIEEQRRTCREQHNKLVTFSLYGDSSSTSCASTGSQCNTYFIAGLAYDAHVNDIRSDLSGTQTVNTYWMDVLENQVFKHKNQYWLATKYGGFIVPSGFSPYASGNSSSTIPSPSWYAPRGIFRAAAGSRSGSCGRPCTPVGMIVSSK